MAGRLPNCLKRLELLRAANEEQFNLHKVGMIFKRDVSLSYRLLRYLNSAASAFPSEIHWVSEELAEVPVMVAVN
jgi:c-di-GMP-related signal transduction protein